MMNPPSRPSTAPKQSQTAVGTAQSGIIYQGAATGATITTPTSSDKNIVHKPKFANAILSILNPIDEVDENVKTKSIEERKRCAGEVLDRLIPPLFCQMKNTLPVHFENNKEDATSEEEDVGEGQETKKRKLDKVEEKEQDQSKEEIGNSSPNEADAQHLVSNTDRLTSLQKQLEHYKRQNQQLEEQRMSVYYSLVELHECYETGLDGIARANDLRVVPDNVMMDRPGNGS